MPVDRSEDFIPGEYSEAGPGGWDDEDEEESGDDTNDSESMLTELSSLHQDDALPTPMNACDEKIKRLATQFIQAREKEMGEIKKDVSKEEKASVVLPQFVSRDKPKQVLFIFELVFNLYTFAKKGF